MMGAIVTVTKSKPLPLLHKLVDTTFEKFSVYPNPVSGNSSIKIDFKKLNSGKYTMSLMNLSGQNIRSEEVNVETERTIIEIKLKDIAAGAYIVRIFNKKTGRAYSKKIIVQ
jgi:hypothetical protein